MRLHPDFSDCIKKLNASKKDLADLELLEEKPRPAPKPKKRPHPRKKPIDP
jgi:hypothetical protein